MTAEERAITQFKNTFCPTCEDKDICDVSILNCTFYDSIYKQAYLAGLEAGKPKWHDLREDPNDLPPKIMELAISSYVLSENGNLVYYDYEHKTFATSMITPIHIIAWCELPEFEDKAE